MPPFINSFGAFLFIFREPVSSSFFFSISLRSSSTPFPSPTFSLSLFIAFFFSSFLLERPDQTERFLLIFQQLDFFSAMKCISAFSSLLICHNMNCIFQITLFQDGLKIGRGKDLKQDIFQSWPLSCYLPTQCTVVRLLKWGGGNENIPLLTENVTFPF